ncbi:hypothetical protein [Halomonas sp. HL-93]|uniref:hypothetical protein n=1 Tax=Halomonas sp. HL-93 TaxID=1666906 RepID=UPI0007F0F7DE|nr:hypothetical protein [Halomonas sp. HL-93]SBR45150.1 hypothetical protein GA0071314_0096 [Halomonas sp. HL-93]
MSDFIDEYDEFEEEENHRREMVNKFIRENSHLCSDYKSLLSEAEAYASNCL